MMLMFCIVTFLYQVTLVNSEFTVNLAADTSWQYLTSHNYPYNYDRHENERWLITAENGSHVINMKVLYCSLESSAGSLGCLFDYVEIFDGGDNQHPRLTKFCGYSRPNIVSTGNILYINFISDGSIERNGFQIRYWSSVPEDNKSDDSVSVNVPLLVLGCLTALGFVIIFLGTLACCHQNKGDNWCRTCKSAVHVTPAYEDPIFYISDSHYLWPETHRTSLRQHRGGRQIHSLPAPPPYVARPTNVTSFIQHPIVTHVQPAEMPVSPPPPYSI